MLHISDSENENMLKLYSHDPILIASLHYPLLTETLFMCKKPPLLTSLMKERLAHFEEGEYL